MAAFVAVVDAGGFSAAARVLRAPLPTVSRRIAELEKHLGVRLLTRSTRRLALTEAGTRYLQTCRRIIEDIEDAERLAAGEHGAPKGQLVVASPVAFGKLHFAPIVTRFLAAYPDVDVEMRFTDVPVDLIEAHVDASLRIGRLDDSNLVVMHLGAVRHVVCAAPDYLARRGQPKVPADLAKHACVTLTPLHSPSTWSFGHGQDFERIAIRSRFAVSNAEAAVAAAAAGLGVTRVFSYQAAQAIADGRLVLLLEDFEPPALPVQLIYTANRLMPMKLRAFLDFVGPRLRERIVGMPEASGEAGSQIADSRQHSGNSP
jgi:DNA-binding transcriptional LysR family regulator